MRTIKKVKYLSKEVRKLLRMASEARLNAQAPYSNFFVGAAVLSESRMFSSGCNVEAASYSQTSHAEQVAITSLIAKNGSQKIKVVVIVGGAKDSKVFGPCWPCGHCRQIIWENCDGDPDVRIITLVGHDVVEITTIGELFPKPFGPTDLGIKVCKE